MKSRTTTAIQCHPVSVNLMSDFRVLTRFVSLTVLTLNCYRIFHIYWLSYFVILFVDFTVWFHLATDRLLVYCIGLLYRISYVLGAAAASQKTRAIARATATTSPSSKIHVSWNCAFPRFQSRHVHVPNKNPFQTPRSSMLKMPHSTYIKIVCVRLPVATAIWRTVIHCCNL